MTDGSRRESDIEEWLVGLPPATKVLVWLRWYSSSTALRFRFRRKKNTPPAIAPMATIPTTTPAAMAAVLDFGFGVADTEGGGVGL